MQPQALQSDAFSLISGSLPTLPFQHQRLVYESPSPGEPHHLPLEGGTWLLQAGVAMESTCQCPSSCLLLPMADGVLAPGTAQGALGALGADGIMDCCRKCGATAQLLADKCQMLRPVGLWTMGLAHAGDCVRSWDLSPGLYPHSSFTLGHSFTGPQGGCHRSYQGFPICNLHGCGPLLPCPRLLADACVSGRW